MKYYDCQKLKKVIVRILYYFCNYKKKNFIFCHILIIFFFTSLYCLPNYPIIADLCQNDWQAKQTLSGEVDGILYCRAHLYVELYTSNDFQMSRVSEYFHDNVSGTCKQDCQDFF